MLFLRTVAPPAALLMVTLLGSPAFAAEPAAAAAKTPVKEQAVEQVKPDAAKQQAQPAPTDVMVRVNGIAITRSELDRAVKVMLAQNQLSNPGPELLKQTQATALDQLTSAELLYQAASKLQVKDLEKQVTERVAKSKAKFASDVEYEKALKDVDMTQKDIEAFTRKDIIISNFIEQRIAARAIVTDDESRKFYDDNLEKYFTKAESARASHILIGADEKASPEDRKKAKEKAEAILKRVKAGEDFAAIAKAESSCPSSAQGGDLGTFARGQMVPSFDTVVFSMKQGEISDVVETQFGYHVIKLTQKTQGSTDKYEDIKGKIVDHLKKEKVQKELMQFVDGLKKTAKIEKA